MRKFLLSFMLCSVAFGLVAQSRTIKGVVSDKEGPIPMATVVIENTGKGVTADLDGKYEITVAEGETLVFSSTGSLSQKFRIGPKTSETLNVSLKEDSKELDEVIVVGYGQMKKSDLTGAIGSIREDKLRESISISAEQALQGRVAGVQVTQSSGQPGAASSVRIRGTSSLTGSNEPLYVVDGMPIGQGSVTGGANPLASINPNDIVSMEILKDASATAIYGSRGANGVVLITTRKGKAGESKINYDGSFMVAKVGKKMDMMNLKEYSIYMSTPEVTSAMGYQIEYIDPLLSVDPMWLGKGEDWQAGMFQTAYGHTHQLSVTGGAEKTIYAMSLGYQNQKGTMISTDFERFNGRLNVENQTRKWIKTGLTLAFTHIAQAKQVNYDAINTGASIGGTNIGNSPLINALTHSPNRLIYDKSGDFIESSASEYGAPGRINPIADALRSPVYQQSNNTMAQVFVDIEPIKDLHWRTEFNMDHTGQEDTRFFPTSERKLVNQLTGFSRNNFYWRAASTLQYNRKLFIKHNVNMMATGELTEAWWRGIQYDKFDYPFEITDPKYHATGLGGDPQVGGYKGSQRTASLLGRLNYSYDDRYLLTASGRYDGSSNFARENRWGFFPSFSLAWRVNNEHFIKESEKASDLFSNIKLRAGYGQTGNAGWGMGYLSTLSGYNTYQGRNYSATMSRWPNPKLQWETNWQYNAGIDLGLLKNSRISLTVDAFYKQNDNLIVTAHPGDAVSSASWEYISPPNINLGSVRNTGFEITLNTVNISQNMGGRDFEWSTDFSFTKVKNLIVKLDEPYPEYESGYTVAKSIEGHAPGLFWGLKTNGLILNEDQLNAIDLSYFGGSADVGDISYVDLNGDGVINEKDMTFIGDPNPIFTAGFGNNFSYGPWSLTVFFTCSYGNKAYNLFRKSLEDQTFISKNQLNTVRKYARVREDPETGKKYVENPETNMPRPNGKGQQINLSPTSDHWIEDASYIRLQNIALSYRFPKRWMEKISVSDLKLTANVQNLYTFTNYNRGYNPEVANSNVLRQGFDIGSYPAPRTFMFNLNASF
jgi:TonB-linked SusC/RagA family outer membrane protein